MKVNKSKQKGIMISIIFAIAIMANLNAQHMGQGNMGHDQNMNQNTMQHMGQQMMNMQQMMNNLEGMMDRTSGMMDAMHNMDQMNNNGSGNHMNHDTYDMGAGHDMGGNGGDMSGNGMMNMVHSMDEMNKDMQGFMNQMSQMMHDEEMMKDPLMNQYMEDMQDHMETVMSGYDGVITQMEKIQIINSK